MMGSCENLTLRQIKYAEANVDGTVEVQSRFLLANRSQFICENFKVVKGGRLSVSSAVSHHSQI